MKIWRAYGSEHSMNLVMIGHFKSVKDAEKTQNLIEELSEKLGGKIDIDTSLDQYEDGISKVLRETNCYILSLSELEHFQSPKTMHWKDDKIILKVDAMDASAFFKMMIDKNAKDEIFPANHEKDGRSKMVGRFKSTDDAEKAKQLIDKFTEEIGNKRGAMSFRERYNDAARRVLSETGCYILSPSELEHFLYDDNTTRLEDDQVILETDETEVSAFFKLMIKNGAKVEVFSAHDYPDEGDSGYK